MLNRIWDTLIEYLLSQNIWHVSNYWRPISNNSLCTHNILIESLFNHLNYPLVRLTCLMPLAPPQDYVTTTISIIFCSRSSIFSKNVSCSNISFEEHLQDILMCAMHIMKYINQLLNMTLISSSISQCSSFTVLVHDSSEVLNKLSYNLTFPSKQRYKICFFSRTFSWSIHYIDYMIFFK